ncbi:hypothetical protein FB45DRAFT_278295 [Roridomyces roridus]|uniref:DUF6699 domain-containing protein n=1 Tax=Roridomyces roridus TaxID=1738132 RepID=A0AAD7CAQ8_9AGAR|nr:hypothetical protein FB45DRAFT_278295 [Roridomyces roridus]
MGPATRARGRLKEESISLSWPLVKYTKSSKRSRNPLLYFDVGFDPRQHNNLKDNSTGQWLALSNADCHLSASTHCELTSMVIECPLIGPVNIDRPGGICVLDVFSAIYDAYHVRLSSEERPDDVDGRYEATFRKRCEDFKPYPAAEARRGMRRVDLLRGKRIFDGITREGAHWKVELVAR